MLPSVLHRAAGPLRALDRAAGRLRRRRTVLVEVRTPMNLAVLRPVYERLMADPRIDVRFTAADRRDIHAAFNEGGLRPLVVPRRRAAWMRVDLYMNADPWDPVPLRRCARRITFFHGVAGKYDLDRPDGLPLGLHTYDAVAFTSAARMQSYLDAGLVAPRQAALIGYPKVDALVHRRADAASARAALGLAPARPAALYGPTFSPASSLHLAGEAIVGRLLDAGLSAIVKLHDRSYDPDPRYSGGIDWRARFARFAPPDRFLLAGTGDATPYMAAADLLVTDHSSIGFEFCLLDRPIIVDEAPDLPAVARINPEKIALLRRAARVAATLDELDDAVREARRAPGARAAERRRVAASVFYEPGSATARAVSLACHLLCLDPDPRLLAPAIGMSAALPTTQP